MGMDEIYIDEKLKKDSRSKKTGNRNQRRSQSSGHGGEISHGRPLVECAPSQKRKLVVFHSLYFRMALFGPRMGPAWNRPPEV